MIRLYLFAVLYNILEAVYAGCVGGDGKVEVAHCVPALGLLVKHHRLVQGVHVLTQPSCFRCVR